MSSERLNPLGGVLDVSRVLNSDFIEYYKSQSPYRETRVLFKRFTCVDDFVANHLPCVDSHIIMFLMHDGNTLYCRAIAFDIRSSDIYTVREVSNETVAQWKKLTLTNMEGA